nr:fatty-acid-binding protein 1 [Tanacetum cinerariifolium]
TTDSYGKLSIRSVCNAFEDSVRTRLKKFGGSDNKELLQKFTSQFSDEYKNPRGSIINLSKEKGYVLRTTIDGKEVGSVQSKLLCRSILDLYIGDESFDSKAKEDIDNKLTLNLHNNVEGEYTVSFDVVDYDGRPTNHKVVRVNKESFKSCNINAPLTTYETGNDSFTVRGTGHYFFTCSFPGHCDAGQKIDIRVLKTYSQTTNPHTNVNSSTTPAAHVASNMTAMVASQRYVLTSSTQRALEEAKPLRSSNIHFLCASSGSNLFTTDLLPALNLSSLAALKEEAYRRNTYEFVYICT